MGLRHSFLAATLATMAGLLALAQPAPAQVQGFPSVDGSAGIRGNTNPYAYVQAAGYHSPGGGGGGLFYRTGSACPDISLNSGGWSSSSNAIVVSSMPSSSYIGMAIEPGTTNILGYDMIVGVNSTLMPYTITLAVPPIGSGSGTFKISGDNGGSMVRDNESGGPMCYQRVSSDFSALEWGATEDGSSSRSSSEAIALSMRAIFG